MTDSTAAAEVVDILANYRAEVTRILAERDRAREAIYRVTHTRQLWVTDTDGDSFWAIPNDDLRAALDPDPAEEA